MSEYRNAISRRRIALATETALDLWQTESGLPLDDHVRKAVAEVIRACAAGIADDLERHVSDSAADMLDQIGRRAALILSDVGSARPDPVDEASRESFPASDAPSWIWERTDRRKQEE